MSAADSQTLAISVTLYLTVAFFVGMWANSVVWHMKASTRRAARLAGVLAALLMPLFVLALPYGLWKVCAWTAKAGRELFRTFVPIKPKAVELPEARVHR